MITTFVSALVCAAQLALCMLAHECGHIAAARLHRIRVKKVGIRLMGCYVQRERGAGWPEISVCLAGVAVNLALAIAFIHADAWFAICNFTFAWVNLLPIPHSDGRHALEALHELRWNNFIDRIAAQPEPKGR